MIIRHLYLDKVANWIDKPVIKVITGVRRSGKSYLMKMVQALLLSKGISEEQIVYINFELLEYDNLLSYTELYKYIRNQTSSIEGISYIFIDEIQNCDGWERSIASLLAESGYDLYITGSNASMLSGDLATNIAGRYIEIEVYPLNFSEYKLFTRSFDDTEKQDEVLFNEYLKYGGFPGLSNAVDNDEAKKQYLTGIKNTVVLRDVIQRHHVREAILLERVLLYIFDNVGQIFSAKKVSDYLKNIGMKASIDAVASYLRALEDAKIIYAAPRYDIKGKKIMQRMDKYFICDLGLRYSEIGYRDNDIGQILENVVYMELRSRGYKVYVGKEGDREVDFIAEKGDERHYYQVAYYLATQEVKEREFGSLLAINDSYPKTVLTMDRLPIGSIKGVKHEYLIDFLTMKAVDK